VGKSYANDSSAGFSAPIQSVGRVTVATQRIFDFHKAVPAPGNARTWLFLDENNVKEELVELVYPESLSELLRVVLRQIGYYESKLLPYPNDEDTTTTRGPKGIRQAPDDILFVWRNKFTHIK
jgi:hypothetical protein